MMPQRKAQSSEIRDLGAAAQEVRKLKDELKQIASSIAMQEKQVDHPVYGRSAKKTLMELYDRQVLLARRKKSLEKNAEAYRQALFRNAGASSDSSNSSRSKKSTSSKSSASSAPAVNGWWCACGVLNYTEPDEHYLCWGCAARTFDEQDCWWAIHPHPDDCSPWEIDMAHPMRNANNFPN